MQRAHRRWHLRLWIAMALLLPAVLATAAMLRISQSTADAPVRIETPSGGRQR